MPVKASLDSNTSEEDSGWAVALHFSGRAKEVS